MPEIQLIYTRILWRDQIPAATCPLCRDGLPLLGAHRWSAQSVRRPYPRPRHRSYLYSLLMAATKILCVQLSTVRMLFPSKFGAEPSRTDLQLPARLNRASIGRHWGGFFLTYLPGKENLFGGIGMTSLRRWRQGVDRHRSNTRCCCFLYALTHPANKN